MMQEYKYLKNILFLDIETAAQEADFSTVSTQKQELWAKKAKNLKNEAQLDASGMYFDRAAIYAEFGKVICIGFGGIYFDENEVMCFRTKCISGESEAELLTQFKQILEKHPAKKDLVLCAHNGKEFDFPYLCRRMLVNGISLPDCLQMQGKKPWEIHHADTLDLWKFGDYKHYVGLDLLAEIFQIKSSKDDIDGSEVNRVYHIENNLSRIATYCAKDVVVLAQLYLKMNVLPVFEDDNVFLV